MPQHIHAGLPASLSRFTQDTRLLRLTTPLGEILLPEGVRGEEGISQASASRSTPCARTRSSSSHRSSASRPCCNC